MIYSDNNKMSKFFSKVYLWMFIGLLISFATGYMISTNEIMMYNIFSNNMQIFIFLAEIILVIVLTRRINKMEELTAKILFCLYSFVSGITFSSIFILYNVTSLIYVFIITAILFIILSMFGKSTKYDLTKISTYLLIALIGTILTSIINIFIGNSFLDTILSIILVVIFCSMTAYDVQKINKNYEVVNKNESYAIYFALELYLDFINIFLNLLNLFSKGRD